jgi:stage II sporulation protein D
MSRHTGRHAVRIVAALVFVFAVAVSPLRGGSRSPDPSWSLAARTRADTLTVKVGRAHGGGYRVVEMPLEDYVAGVLAGEAAPRSAPAALQALAIAIRTYTAANLGRHRAQGFDLCDETHCQVYRAPTAATQQAAEATAGRILLYDGAPASVYFSAWCGGYTERPSNVWPGSADVPYLPARPDPACAHLSGWSTELQIKDLDRALHAAGFDGRLRTMSAAARDESGRVTALHLEGLKPSEISGQDLRMAVGNALGWQLLKSTRFSMQAIRGGYRFTGRGFGHGVGMCVMGSVEMAAAGKTAADILASYFPGTTIATIAAGTTTATALGAGPDPKAVTSAKSARPAARPCEKKPQPYPGSGCGALK